jgi:hypothetical protein
MLILKRLVVPALALALLPAAAADAKTKTKLLPVCKHGQKSTKKHKCVTVPRGAKRPRGRRQQGGPNNVIPVPTGLGLGANGYDREESAIAWAEGLLHEKKYAWLCERFVENAFNVSDVYDSAADAAKKLGPLHQGKPPRGALVFFRPEKLNYNLGHVGIAVSPRRFISAVDTVQEANFADGNGFWQNRYMGWTYAPDSWRGRFIVPTAPDAGIDPNGPPPTGPQPTGTPVSTTPAVSITSPAAGDTLTGTVTLTAHTANASGVEFDAFYAADPNDANTLGWHKLGTANPTGGDDWALPYNTKAIPDQGNAGWGTVNVLAIALDASGNLTAGRDFHRVAVSNPAASTPDPTPDPTPPPAPTPEPTPPPAPTFYAYHVVGTCGEGACGLKKRAGPGYSGYAQVGIVYDGNEIDIVCQTTGEAVAGRRATSAIWDRLTDGSYVSDYYTDTPVVGGFSPPIPHC